MNGKPRIGMTARAPSALLACRRSVEQSGGEVVVIELRLPRAELRRLYDSLDGLLLPGGAGLAWAARRHHASATAGLSRNGAHPELESTDCLLARWALADDRPLLGICRGIQMIALAVGGRLDRDVAGHRLGGVFPAHHAVVSPGSRLRDVFGAERTTVNSRHHRAVSSLPESSGFAITARSAEDGVVEGIESQRHRFACGVQFHPENLVEFHEPSRRLFRHFVAACHREGAGLQ